jgi:hypothetical protein
MIAAHTSGLWMRAPRKSPILTRLAPYLAVVAMLISAAPVKAQDDTSDKAQETAKTCEVPAHLLANDDALKRVAQMMKETRRLDVLVVGTGSSALQGPGAQRIAYPARLEVALQQKLGDIKVNVSVEIQPRQTASETAELLPKLVADRKPALVIWQTGTIDAMRAVEADEFTTALDDGITAIQDAGADAVVINMQYSPRTETMISATPYLDAMRVMTQRRDVALFDRYAIMRHWSETGEFDLYGAFHGLGLARRVHDCLARALATFVLSGVALAPANGKVQH